MENNIENNVENTTEVKTENTTNNSNNLLSIIIVLCVLAIGVFLLLKTNPPVRDGDYLKGGNYQDVSQAEFTPVTSDDHILGDPNAEIIVVEYSDTECPFCKRFHTTMHQIITENEGKVAWVYRHFPIPELHQKAYNEALATECAFEQGGNEAFWLYTDQIYARTNSNDSLPESELTNIAKDLKMDLTKFNICLTNETYKEKVEAQILSGQKMNVFGTPTSFIVVNGEVVDTIEGALPYKNVTAQLQPFLK